MRRGIVLVLVALGAATLLVVPSATPVSAGGSRTVCDDVLSGGTYGDVVVPPGAECHLLSAIVNGHLRLHDSSSAFVEGSEIYGNVTGSQFRRIWLIEGTVVHGDVHLKRSKGFGVQICSSTVHGYVRIAYQKDGIIQVGALHDSCGGNRIGGNLQIFKNTLTGFEFSTNQIDSNEIGGNAMVMGNRGALAITFNSVAKDLNCSKNYPAPTVEGNSARRLRNQCK